MPRAQIPSSSSTVDDPNNTSITNISKPTSIKVVGFAKVETKRKMITKDKKKKKVAKDVEEEVEVPIVDVIVANRSNTQHLDFKTRPKLMEMLANKAYNFDLAGKIRKNSSNVSYIFTSDSEALNVNHHSKYVYVKLRGIDLKDIGHSFYKDYSGRAPFIKQGFEFLINEPSLDTSTQGIKLYNSNIEETSQKQSSIIKKLPPSIVERYLLEPTVPNGTKLTKTEIEDDLLDEWIENFQDYEDWEYLLSKKSILLCSPILDKLPAAVPKNTKSDFTAMEFLQKCYRNNSRDRRLKAYHNIWFGLGLGLGKAKTQLPLTNGQY